MEYNLNPAIPGLAKGEQGMKLQVFKFAGFFLYGIAGFSYKNSSPYHRNPHISLSYTLFGCGRRPH